MIPNIFQKSPEYYQYHRSDMIQFVPDNCSVILDIGCGEGNFGATIKENMPHAEIHGVEINDTAARAASGKLDRVYNCDVYKAIDTIRDRYYDCVVFNDVIEHFVDPVDVLIKIKPKIKPGGVILASIPNLRFFPVIKDLVINKKWSYTESGILDYTHLHFYTEKSIPELFCHAGYQLISLHGINRQNVGRLFSLLNLLCLGRLSDMRYLQFACLARPI